jgi:hypothetical protein
MLKEQVLKTLPVPNHQRHFANFIIINAIEYEAHETSSKNPSVRVYKSEVAGREGLSERR